MTALGSELGQPAPRGAVDLGPPVPAGYHALDDHTVPVSEALKMEREARLTPRNVILCGDVRERLRELPDESVHCVVTSPPYWSLRDYRIEPVVWGGEEGCEHLWTGQNRNGAIGERYTGSKRWQHGEPSGNGHAILRSERSDDWERVDRTSDLCAHCGAWRGALGLEPTPELYVEHMVEVMREVRRVLRRDGTCWLNLGDSYAGSGKGLMGDGTYSPEHGTKQGTNTGTLLLQQVEKPQYPGLKPKDLVGIPWRVAFALQADGWWLRSDIVWSKPNPMPESVTDRPTKSHEYVFLLTRAERYFFDADAIREPHSAPFRTSGRNAMRGQVEIRPRGNLATIDEQSYNPGGRNARSVWEIATQPYSEAHFATFPEALARRCILAGTSERGCCPDCGAPWRRVVAASGGTLGKGSWHDHGADSTAGMSQSSRLNAVGWEPTCKHYDHVWRELRRSRRWKRRRYEDKLGLWFRRAAVPRLNVPEFLNALQPPLVLDPFIGSGTVGVAARDTVPRRDWLGIEMNPEYVTMAEKRIGPGRLL